MQRAPFLFLKMDITPAKHGQKHTLDAGRRLHKRVFAAMVAFVVALVFGWSFLPATRKAQIMRAVPLGGSYATFDRLANRLRLGMTPVEVRGILGESEHVSQVLGGQRWRYDEVDATTGWVCIVDFAADGRFQYFLNVAHVAFPSSAHREFGKPLDDGRFDGELGLQFYRKRQQKIDTNSPPTI